MSLPEKTYIEYGGKRLSLEAVERYRAASAAYKRRRRAAGDRIDYNRCACGAEKGHQAKLCRACELARRAAVRAARDAELLARWGTGETGSALATAVSQIRARGIPVPYRTPPDRVERMKRARWGR